MKETNVQRVISNFVMDKTYHPKSDKLRLDEDGAIYNCGLRIGQFEEGEVTNSDGEVVWTKFLVLPLKDHFKSWKRYKLQLAHEANKWGIIVVFERNFTIGFGEDKERVFYYSNETLFKDLIKVARYSQDKDIKTAACASVVDSREENCPAFDEIVAYSYNQLLNEETMLHAEQAVVSYYRYLNVEGNCPRPRRWITLLQSCELCIKEMLNVGATQIFYGWPHKNKWNTEAYYELASKLESRAHYQPFSSVPTWYIRRKTKEVENFYKRKVK